MNREAIILKNVRKTFQFKKNIPDSKNSQDFVALDDVSFSVPEGSTVGIIGLNGLRDVPYDVAFAYAFSAFVPDGMLHF